MKYIRHSEFGFILWKARSGMLSHQDMWLSVAVLPIARQGKLLSAGFVNFELGDGEPACYGDSGSLNLECLPDDTAMLKKQLGLK